MQSTFAEITVYGDKDRPDENYIQFFSYYDLLCEKSKNYPYYSLSKYTIDDSTYVSSQNYVFTDDHEDSLSVNIDYFETDHKYLMNRYKFEKSIFYSVDENGNEIAKTQIDHELRDGSYYDVICLETQKRMIVQNGSYYFTLSIEDPQNVFKMDRESFIEFGYRELKLLQKYVQS